MPKFYYAYVTEMTIEAEDKHFADERANDLIPKIDARGTDCVWGKFHAKSKTILVKPEILPDEIQAEFF